jgi:hypothetical protein
MPTSFLCHVYLSLLVELANCMFGATFKNSVGGENLTSRRIRILGRIRPNFKIWIRTILPNHGTEFGDAGLVSSKRLWTELDPSVPVLFVWCLEDVLV